MKRAGALLIIIALLGAVTVRAHEEGSITAVAGNHGVYIHWGQGNGSSAVHDVYRQKAGAGFVKLARVVPLRDATQAKAIFQAADDPYSSMLAPNGDLPQLAEQDPKQDEYLGLASPAYARMRGFAYLDTTAERGATYRYRVVEIGTDGKESVIGEIEITAGKPRPQPIPAVSATVEHDVPVLKWAGVSCTAYKVLRSNDAKGVFDTVTMLPLPPSRQEQPFTYRDENAPKDGRTLYYKVVPLDLLGQPGPESAIVSAITMDRTPPSPPTALTTAAFPGGVRLGWHASVDLDLAGYHVYRSEVNRSPASPKDKFGERVRLTSKLLPASDNKYDDATAVAGKVYVYQLSAVDTNQNESALSAMALASPRNRTPPAKPTGLTAEAKEEGKVLLFWNANHDSDLYSYRVYQAAGPQPEFTLVKEIPAGDPHARPQYELRLDEKSQDTFRFAIAAVDNSENESARSEPVSVRLPDHVPPAVPVITALRSGDGYVEVGWSATAEPDLAGFNVYRRTPEGAGIRLNSTLLTAQATTFKDQTTQPRQAYFYSVSAVDTSRNESGRSEERSTSAFFRAKSAAPSGLAVRDAAGGKPTLTWKPTEHALGYLVYSSPERDGEYTEVSTRVLEPRFELSGRAAAWYRVQAVYSARVSELSDPVQLSGHSGPEAKSGTPKPQPAATKRRP